MKSRKICLALSVFFIALSAMAQWVTPANFIPIAVETETPFRSFIGLGASTVFKSPVHNRFDWLNSQFEYSLTYSIFSGLDVGLGVRMGVFSPNGIGRDVTSNLGNEGVGNAGPIFGADAMIRHLWTLDEMFYLGLQGQVGYGYTCLDPNSADRSSSYHSIPIVLGVPFGMVFTDIATVYLSPGVELGQTPSSNQVNLGLWKNAVGIQMAMGAAFNFGKTKLVAQLKPRVADVTNMSNWGMDAVVGFSWDY